MLHITPNGREQKYARDQGCCSEGPQQTGGMGQQESYKDINNNLRVVQLRARSPEKVFRFSVLKDFQNTARHSPGQPHLTLNLAML